jgi:hypothetical protein
VLRVAGYAWLRNVGLIMKEDLKKNFEGSRHGLIVEDFVFA